jgi:hypothetical protein
MEPLLKCLLISWFVTHFEPLTIGLDRFMSKMPTNLILDTLYEIITCYWCFSLWFTLIFTGDIWLALSASFLAWSYKKIIK